MAEFLIIDFYEITGVQLCSETFVNFYMQQKEMCSQVYSKCYHLTSKSPRKTITSWIPAIALLPTSA